MSRRGLIHSHLKIGYCLSLKFDLLGIPIQPCDLTRMRRFTRLTNAFSKKFENHCHMVALYAVWCNFIRIHKTLRVTPAMEAGVTDRLFTYEELIGIVDEWEANQKDKESRSL
jgi:hypothetical protein